MSDEIGRPDDFRRLLRYLKMVEMDKELPTSMPPLAKITPENFISFKLQKVIDWAVQEWLQPVKEPPGVNFERIDRYIRSPDGSNWTLENPPYDKNGEVAWCGHFTSTPFRALGLDPAIVKSVLQSTYRLWNWANQNKGFVQASQMKPGDIVIVGPDYIKSGGQAVKAKEWGMHITLCLFPPGAIDDIYSVAPGFSGEKLSNDEMFSKKYRTIEGNAMGYGPMGPTKYEGVTTNIRPINRQDDFGYYVKHVVRFKPENYKDWVGNRT